MTKNKKSSQSIMIEEKHYLQILEESFPGISVDIMRLETLGFSWGSISKRFLKIAGNEILSHVGLLEYPMLIEGQWHTAGALHCICTKATHRNQGLATELIQEALAWAKARYEFVVLFTEIPKFYEKLSFRYIQEYRFHLPCQHPKGSQPLIPLISPQDDALLLSTFQTRASLSHRLCVKDSGAITSFNAIFATYPTYNSLHYSPSINGIVSCFVKDKTLHLFDIIASEIPSLDVICDHFPTAIDEIYFYFSPDRLTTACVSEPYLYDNGHFMVHGNWPQVASFMISPLSRC